MNGMINKVGTIGFDNVIIDIYDSLDAPLFQVIDIVRAIGMPDEKFWDIISWCENDEIIILPRTIDDDGFARTYMTESGLYNVLSQSREVLARKWRRIIIKELIELRKSRGMNIVEQFEDWDHQLDDLYFDEDTGILMRSVLTQGGDVMQVPYGSEESEDING